MQRGGFVFPAAIIGGLATLGYGPWARTQKQTRDLCVPVSPVQRHMVGWTG